MWALRDYKPKPPGRQLLALYSLCLRLDSRTGCGWAYNAQVSEDTGGMSEDSVSAATKWARDHLLLHRAVKGGRITDERKSGTLWVLVQPTGGTGPTPQTGGVGEVTQTRKPGGLASTQTRKTTPPKPAKRGDPNPHHGGSTGKPIKAKPIKANNGAAAQPAVHGTSTQRRARKPSTEAATPSLFPGLPGEELKPNQLAGQLADAFVAAVPLSSRPATFSLVLRAINCGKYTHDRIRSAVKAVADGGDLLTRERLFYALEGRPARTNGQARPGQHRNYQDPDDKSVYQKGFRDAHHK